MPCPSPLLIDTLVVLLLAFTVTLTLTPVSVLDNPYIARLKRQQRDEVRF